MFHRLGQFLQLLGLVMLPLSIAGNLSPNNPMDLKTSLTLSGVGILLFYVGYLLRKEEG